jgi:hypothetical protein
LLKRPRVNPIRCSIYKGRQPSPRFEGVVDLLEQNPRLPHEATADGCPGGWYRTGYVDSVDRYRRRRTEHGGRVANPFFDSASWQVQEAALYLEHEQERWHAHRAEMNHEAWERKQSAAAKKAGRRGTRR